MPYFGKYRGQVIDNIDPMMMARVLATVPAVEVALLGWAMPCSPYGGSGVGLVTVPPVGANVWVEFEGGDVNFPIWSGCFWGPGELPAEATAGDPDKIQVLKSEGFLLKASSAGPNEFVIEVSPPLVDIALSLTMNEEGIFLRNSTGVSVHLAPDTLTLLNEESTIEMTTEAISIAQGGMSEVTLDSEGVHISAGEPNIEVLPGSIEITNGSSVIEVSPATVDVNNGALTVL